MASKDEKGLSEILRDLWELLRDYARQETVEPLKGLGRYLGFGIAGSVLIGIGVILLVLGGLRLAQTEAPDTFDGWASAAPYAIAFVFCVVVVVIAGWRISKQPKRRV